MSAEELGARADVILARTMQQRSACIAVCLILVGSAPAQGDARSSRSPQGGEGRGEGGLSAITLVRANASEAALHPTGRIAFISRSTGKPQLHWAPSLDSPSTRIDVDGIPDTPAWSPDAKRIAFTIERHDNSDIAWFDLESGETKIVVESEHNDLHPLFSSTGEQLIYTRYVREGQSGTLRVYERDLRPGGAETPLLRGAQASYASWSPDDRWLAFWHFTDTDNAEIAIARSDGSELRNLTHDSAFDGWPSWSPDGRHLAFARQRGDDADIYVVDITGARECLVAAGGGRKTSPKWDPDGRSVLFDRAHAGAVDLMRVRVSDHCLG